MKRRDTAYIRRAVIAATVGSVIAICGCSTWSAAQTDDALAELFHRAAVHRVPDGKGTEGGGL